MPLPMHMLVQSTFASLRRSSVRPVTTCRTPAVAVLARVVRPTKVRGLTHAKWVRESNRSAAGQKPESLESIATIEQRTLD